MIEMILSKPDVEFGWRAFTVKWDEPMTARCPRGKGRCTISYDALSSVDLRRDEVDGIAMLRIRWPGYDIVTCLLPESWHRLSEAERSSAVEVASVQCEMLADRLRERMENA